MNKKNTPQKAAKVEIAPGVFVYDSHETRFVMAWKRKTAGKVWDKTVGKYGAWVTPKEVR